MGNQVSYLLVGNHKNNARIWIEGKRLAACGFARGQVYVMVLDVAKNAITLKATKKGDKVVSGRKNSAGNILPIIDLCNADITGHIKKHMGDTARVRVDFEYRCITISISEIEKNAREREIRLAKHAETRRLTEGVVCAGGGISTWALAEGLHDVGHKTTCEWILDMDGKYLQSAMDRIPVVTKDTRIFEATVEEIEPTLLKPVDILSASLPCVGFSKSGISKKGLKFPEADDSGTAFIGLLDIIRHVNPSIIVHENVPSFGTSVTCHVLVSYLTKIGYVVQQKMLGKEVGAFENRNRHFLVAVSKGLADHFDVDDIKPCMTAPKKLGDVLEKIPLDSPRWKVCDYLAKKEERDIAAGKGFRRQLLDASAKECGTIGRGYWKLRSTEPFVIHPKDSTKSRILTPREHAAVKGIPYEAVDGLSDKVAHEILGQSVLFPAFRSIGRFIGESCKAIA